MKRIITSIVLALTMGIVFSSCREQTPGEKIEEGVEEVGEGLEDAVE